jgi:hypothetical protein
MFKKMIVGVLLVGVIGVLIAGAVVRTNAKLGDGTVGEAGRGRTTVSAATAANGGGQRSGREAQGEQAVVGSGQGVPQAEVTAEDWLVVSGTVTSVADDLVEIKTDVGAVIPLQGRPLSFAAERGFALEVGEVVNLSGFEENGAFTIGKVTKLSDNSSVVLRDADGRPGWAGRGRRG